MPNDVNRIGPHTNDAATILRRPICKLLGCTYPVVLAGMGGVARAELVGAVTEAGGFGFLGMVREPVALIRSEVQRVRAQTGRKFGVNLIPAATDPALLDAQIAVCIELKVPVVGLFWDVFPSVVQKLRDAGILVVYQVGSGNEARAAQQAGAQVLIAQGREAGGHVRGEQPLARLLPQVLAATSVPVLAAGGIVDGSDMAAALSLGAQGVVLGTAFIPTRESFAHAYHMQRIVDSVQGDTVLTTAFHINWPEGAKVRVLANSVTRGEHGNPVRSATHVIGDEEGRPIYLFSTDSPLRSMTGDFEAMALYAGLGAGRITTIVSAAERLQGIVTQAAACLASPVAPPETRLELASPPCFADEMDAAYMGYAAPGELLTSLNELLEAERAGARVTLQSAAQAQASGIEQLVTRIHHDEVRWCGVLIRVIQSLHGMPTRKTAAFCDQAMAIDDLSQRLAFLNRGQDQVAKKLLALLPRIRDEGIQGELAAMLASHRENIARLHAQLGTETATVPPPGKTTASG